jgi:hypothetical protein
VYARSATLSPLRSSEMQCRWKLQAKQAFGLDPWVETGSRQGNVSNQDPERRFDSIETEKALGMIQQVKVRQLVQGKVAAERGIAVAAVTADSGHLDRALIEPDIVALMSLGC